MLTDLAATYLIIFSVVALGFLFVGLVKALPYLIAITASVLGLMGFFYLLGAPLSLS